MQRKGSIYTLASGNTILLADSVRQPLNGYKIEFNPARV